MSRTVLGIDPGGRDTGLCVRRGTDVLEHRTVHRGDDEDHGGRGVGVGPVYVWQVLQAIAELDAKHSPDLRAVEGVVSPNGRKHGKVDPINPAGIIAGAMVLGGILGRYPDIVVVPPGHNGDGVLGSYPLDLVGPRERTSKAWQLRVGTGILRHARAAYDVAGRAFMLARQRASMQA